MNNYKTKQLFHDPFHPTNLFFYEIFREIIMKLENYELIFEDSNFIELLNNIELTHWTLPILPIIQNILELKLEKKMYIFGQSGYGGSTGNKLYMDVYDYYYIRLSHENFNRYLTLSCL